MNIQNTYIPQVSLNDVLYVLAKDKSSGRILKVPVRELQGETVIEIVQFMGKVIPSGLLLCDGKMYLQANYPALYEAIGNLFSLPGDDPDTTFRVPDLVTGNRFLLSGDDINYVPARDISPVGVKDYIYCDDNILNHTHSGVSFSVKESQTRGSTDVIWAYCRIQNRATAYVGSAETAGKNMAVNFCIRTGPISEEGLERQTTDGQIRETTYSETRIVTVAG